ncbi:hypothetical protein DM02DRAFT_622369 [Periconia macrospinosa]|uniref:Uncharacterized protein n=1 Tax=Periconia macrospinosa TaxID=97972 RepID=A0A2V1EA72_9PLEO|nr:hypothetical protein DM02DRAFT_622369 [Periconia macrospinosa]
MVIEGMGFRGKSNMEMKMNNFSSPQKLSGSKNGCAWDWQLAIRSLLCAVLSFTAKEGEIYLTFTPKQPPKPHLLLTAVFLHPKLSSEASTSAKQSLPLIGRSQVVTSAAYKVDLCVTQALDYLTQRNSFPPSFYIIVQDPGTDCEMCRKLKENGDKATTFRACCTTDEEVLGCWFGYGAVRLHRDVEFRQKTGRRGGVGVVIKRLWFGVVGGVFVSATTTTGSAQPDSSTEDRDVQVHPSEQEQQDDEHGRAQREFDEGRFFEPNDVRSPAKSQSEASSSQDAFLGHAYSKSIYRKHHDRKLKQKHEAHKEKVQKKMEEHISKNEAAEALIKQRQFENHALPKKEREKLKKEREAAKEKEKDKGKKSKQEKDK